MKSFVLFFTVIMLLMSFIFYDRMKDETAHLRENILLKLKNYSLGSEEERFGTAIISHKSNDAFYKLYEDGKGLYIVVPDFTPDPEKMMPVTGLAGTIFVPYSDNNTKVRKIWYPKDAYQKEMIAIRRDLLWQFVLFALGAMVLSLLAAWYTLYPLRSSLHLLEDFIKDMIHDLNTPLSAIMLNLNMLETENEEIESIRKAVQTIEMLHHNLDAYLRERHQPVESFDLKEVISAQVAFFASLYEDLHWEVKVESLLLYTDRQAFSRIVYNLLSNAGKYNTTDGHVEIVLEGTQLRISNSSYGVSKPEKVFERFYKESDRGLGIGLHIVKKLCKQTGIPYTFSVEGSTVTVVLECSIVAVQ